eukprot:461940_1
MVGSGVGAKYGVLIKGGEALEQASRVTAVVFDKTGTLTRGEPVVNDVILLSDSAMFLFGGSESMENVDKAKKFELYAEEKFEVESGKSVMVKKLTRTPMTCGEPDNANLNDIAVKNILRMAASAEYSSEHPLSKGILKKAAEHNVSLEQVDGFVNEAGSGIRCRLGEKSIHIGNRRSLKANGIETREGTLNAMQYLEDRGQTAVVVSIDGVTEAVIGLLDRARVEAAQVVNILRQKMGIQVYMLTGDNARTAAVVARDIGIPPSFIIADVLPEGKVLCIKQLQEDGHCVAMCGDGVNDSPAMAQSDIGIAIGSGTDVAVETAGIVLMNSSLSDVLVALDLSRTVFRRIKLNFCWALGYNTLALPVAAGTLYPWLQLVLPPFMAAVAMILSSLSVLCSSLLLNLYRPPSFENRSSTDALNGETVSDDDIHAGYAEQIRNKVSALYPGCSRQWSNICLCGKKCKCSVMKKLQ